jgi:hypothetical protein
VVRRLAPLAPLLAALGADGAAAHRLAFYVLLLAVPAVVIAGLDRFAAALDGDGETREAVLLGLALALVVLSAAARGPHLAENAAPALAVSALGAALALAVVPALRALAAAPLHLALRHPH